MEDRKEITPSKPEQNPSIGKKGFVPPPLPPQKPPAQTTKK